MTSSSFVSPLDCLTSFLGISLSRAVSSFGRITNVSKSAITAESYIRSWRKPPEIPEVCRMYSAPHPRVLVLSVRAEHCSSWVACSGQAGGWVGRPRWPSHGDDGSSPDAPSVVSNGYWGIPHYDVTLSEFPVDKISVCK